MIETFLTGLRWRVFFWYFFKQNFNWDHVCTFASLCQLFRPIGRRLTGRLANQRKESFIFAAAAELAKLCQLYSLHQTNSGIFRFTSFYRKCIWFFCEKTYFSYKNMPDQKEIQHICNLSDNVNSWFFFALNMEVYTKKWGANLGRACHLERQRQPKKLRLASKVIRRSAPKEPPLSCWTSQGLYKPWNKFWIIIFHKINWKFDCLPEMLKLNKNRSKIKKGPK